MKIANYDGLTDTFSEIELQGDAKTQMENDIAQFATEKAERENVLEAAPYERTEARKGY